MINFVAYFSTAQDQLGYILLDGHGTAPAVFVGGPALAHGTYRVDDGTLVLVEAAAGASEVATVGDGNSGAENVWPSAWTS